MSSSGYKSFRPVTGRDWTLLALGAAGALLLMAVVSSRYEVIPTHTANNFLRVDRWTGSVTSCFNTHCQPVDDGQATAAAGE